LEEVDAQTVVNIKTLLSELASLLHGAFGGGRYGEGATVSAPSLLVETDVAVPMSLFLVEQLSVIYRAGLQAGRTLDLEIVAERRDEDSIALVIVHETVPPLKRTSRGPDFAAAYLKQLRAQMTSGEIGRRTSIQVHFPLKGAGTGIVG
jgi:hypothetical protein